MDLEKSLWGGKLTFFSRNRVKFNKTVPFKCPDLLHFMKSNQELKLHSSGCLRIYSIYNYFPTHLYLAYKITHEGFLKGYFKLENSIKINFFKNFCN